MLRDLLVTCMWHVNIIIFDMCECVYDEESKNGWECAHTSHTLCVTGVEHHCLPVRSVRWLYMFYSANIDTTLLPLHHLFCLHSSGHLVGSAALPRAIQNPAMCLCQLALHCQFYFISSLAVLGVVLMRWWIIVYLELFENTWVVYHVAGDDL